MKKILVLLIWFFPLLVGLKAQTNKERVERRRDIMVFPLLLSIIMFYNLHLAINLHFQRRDLK